MTTRKVGSFYHYKYGIRGETIKSLLNMYTLAEGLGGKRRSQRRTTTETEGVKEKVGRLITKGTPSSSTDVLAPQNIEIDSSDNEKKESTEAPKEMLETRAEHVKHKEEGRARAFRRLLETLSSEKNLTGGVMLSQEEGESKKGTSGPKQIIIDPEQLKALSQKDEG